MEIDFSQKPTEAELRELYWTQGMSAWGISILYDVSDVTIFNWLKKFKIPTKRVKKFDVSKVTLEVLYEEREMSLSDIAIHFGVHWTTVQQKMKKYGIPRRTSREGMLLKQKQTGA